MPRSWNNGEDRYRIGTEKEPPLSTHVNWLFQRSLTKDLSLGLSLAVVVFSLVLGGAIFAYQTHRSNMELENRADLISDRFSQSLSRAAWDLDDNVAQNIGAAYLYSETVVGVRILFAPDTLVFEVPPKDNMLVFQRERAIIHEVAPGQKYDAGSVTIWFSRDSIRAIQGDLLRMFGITLFFSILAVLLAIRYFMTAFLIKPMSALQQSIRSIAKGDYASSIPPVPQKDVNAIITDINHMAERIAEHTSRLDDEVRERRQAEQALHESNQQMQTLSDNLPSGYVYQLITDQKNEKREFIFISAGVERLHGVTADAVRRDATLLYDQYREDISRIQELEAAASRNMTQFSVEARYRPPSGDVGWMSITSAPRLLPDGDIVWDGVAVDITERKNAEAELLRTNAELQAAERLARMGSWKYDPQQDIFTGSEEMFRIIGMGDAEEIPFERVLSMVHEDDQTFMLAMRDQLLRSPRPFDFDLRLSVQGKLKWVRIVGDVEVGGDNRIVLFRGMLQDITEKKQLEITKREQEAQLAQASKMSALGALVAGVAHEINNPNNLIMLNAPLLERVWNDASPILEQHCQNQPGLKLAGIAFVQMREHVHELFSGINEGSKRIARIISELKDFARQSPLNMSDQVDINAVVESSLVLIGKTISKYTDEFSVSLARGIPPIQGDHHKLEQVVVNLLLNACQALTDRKQAVSLETLHFPDSKAVVVRITDQGEGVRPENMDRIFDPFFSTRQNIGGTGLGLPISFSIIKDHGGSLQFDSSPGQGTVVTVDLAVSPE